MTARPVTMTPTPAMAAPYGFGKRVANATKDFFAAIFSPQEPPAPGPDTQREGARQWEYRPGYNLVYTPRASENLTPFGWLRSVSDVYDMARICIRYRKEEMGALDWSIVPLDEKKPPSDAQLSEARTRLEKPDGQTRWPEWLGMAMEEVLVTDALTIYPEKTRRGEILSLDLVAGDTIRPLVDGRGRRPAPPTLGFQQVLYGRPFWEGTTDDLIYAPKNPRVNSAYGRSPIEEIVLTINRTLARQSFDFSWFKDGNIPDAMVPAPAEMGMEQIEVLQDWFDNIVNMPMNRRKVHFVPSSNGRLTPFEFKQQILDTNVEEFLFLITQAAIGVQPQELGFTNKVNRSTASMQENAQIRRRVPYIRFMAALLTDTLHSMDYPDVAMQFKGDRPEEDKLAQAKVDQIYLDAGVIADEEVRQRQGLGVSNAPRYRVVGPNLVQMPSSAAVVHAAEATEDEDIEQNMPEDAEEVNQSRTSGARPLFLSAASEVSTGPVAAPVANQSNARTAAPSEANVQRSYDEAHRELRRFGRFREHDGVHRKAFRWEHVPPELAEAVETAVSIRPETENEKQWNRGVLSQAAALLVGGWNPEDWTGD